MMNVNMSSNLQGVQGWDQLAGLLKAGETQSADGASVSIADKQITVTITNGTATRSVSISVPDLGPMDSVPDAEALQSIADKIVALADSLAAFGAFNADGTFGKELQGAIDRLQASLARLSEPSTDPTTNLTNTSKALFDLFALMALMVEVAQKQRDTSREIRLVENQQVQSSIKQQAEDMRAAAAISLAFGIVTSVISGAMSIVSMAAQAKAFSQQTSATSQLETPAENLQAAELAMSPAAAEAHLQNVTQKTPEATQQKVNEEFSAAKVDFERDIAAADLRVHDAEVAQDQAADELTAAKNKQNPPATPEELKLKSEAYDKASQELMDARANRASIERGFFSKLETRLKANEVEIKTKQGDPANKQAVADLRKENTYLRAYTAKLKADHASDTTKNSDLSRAQAAYDRAKQEVQLDKQFTGSQQMMNRWMGIQQLQMSFFQMANASGTMISQMVQAQATMEGVEQTQHNEQLDQIKDLFQQAETVVQAVVQLMQAVLSAENESIMEAIRA